MQVRFWGTRGSIATPGPQTAHYGGNTACVEVRGDDGTLIVLDCGTGVRELGRFLLHSTPHPLRIHLLIGHTHWDHIQGFPFFEPAFLSATELTVYAPRDVQHSLEEALARQMQYPYFPVPLHDLHSRIHYTELEEGFFQVGDVRVETHYLNHAAPTLAYRLSSGGSTVAYVTDHESFWDPVDPSFPHPGDQQHIAFLKGADLVIHDAQYTLAEYRHKIGWGHSTVEYATDIAQAAGVARLALFHHDPTHDDATLERIEAAARTRVAASGGTLDVFAAAEGLTLEVRGKGSSTTVTEKSALQRRPIDGRCVMVVSADELQVAATVRALVDDDIILVHAPDRHTALQQAPLVSPDLVIINRRLPDGDGVALIRPLQTHLEQPDLPIILLTDGCDAETTFPREATAAMDYLATPLNPAMVRTRIRTCLARLPSQGPLQSRNRSSRHHRAHKVRRSL